MKISHYHDEGAPCNAFCRPSREVKRAYRKSLPLRDRLLNATLRTFLIAVISAGVIATVLLVGDRL